VHLSVAAVIFDGNPLYRHAFPVIGYTYGQHDVMAAVLSDTSCVIYFSFVVHYLVFTLYNATQLHTVHFL